MALSNGPNLRTATRSFSVIVGSFGIITELRLRLIPLTPLLPLPCWERGFQLGVVLRAHSARSTTTLLFPLPAHGEGARGGAESALALICEQPRGVAPAVRAHRSNSCWINALCSP